MTQELVKTYASVLGEKQELFKTEKTELGKCPRCKSPVYEGKKNYYGVQNNDDGIVLRACETGAGALRKTSGILMVHCRITHRSSSFP